MNTPECRHVLIALDESPRPSARLSACQLCGEVSDFDPQPIARSAGLCSMSTRDLTGGSEVSICAGKTGHASRIFISTKSKFQFVEELA